MISLTVDDSALVRALGVLERGIGAAAPRAGLDEARTTADAIRSGVPVRSGRLVGTVDAVPADGGGAVTYGGGLPYAGYIERRTGAVAAGVRAGADRFPRACARVADHEAGRI